MRSFIPLSVFAFGFASAEWEIGPTPEKPSNLGIPRFVPDVSVLEASRSYVVKLDCLGCPFALKTADNGAFWRMTQENALRLKFSIEKAEASDPTLLLNGRQVLPLEPLPLSITTWQVPSNLTTDAEDKFLLSPSADEVPLHMAFEHTILRTEEGGQRWLQFDVTGIQLADSNSGGDKTLVQLNEKSQKLVQIMLNVNDDTRELTIGDVQTVEREHRAQPFTMKCGKPAMFQTQYNPAEWDEYGRIGSWSRSFKLAINFFDIQHNTLVLPLALMLALVVIMARRSLQREPQDTRFVYDDEAQVALLDMDFEDLPPAYANIPTFKIEEYD